jgi:hypothetical protein
LGKEGRRVVILRWQHLTAPRDVMTDDLQEKCMSRTRMSCHFIIHNAQCLPLNLAYRSSLTGPASPCCSSPHLCCCTHRPCSSVQTRAFTRTLLPSSHAQLNACQCFALAHFPCLPAHCCLAVHHNNFPSPPLLFFSSTTSTSCHCTAPRH